MSNEQYDRWNLNSTILSGPLRTCPGPNPNLLSERVFFSECPEPVWGHTTGLTSMVDRSTLIAPTAYSVFAMITVVYVKVHITSWYKLNCLEFSYNRCELNCKVYCCLPSFTVIHTSSILI
jgi:hypothetical protein